MCVVVCVAGCIAVCVAVCVVVCVAVRVAVCTTWRNLSEILEKCIGKLFTSCHAGIF